MPRASPLLVAILLAFGICRAFSHDGDHHPGGSGGSHYYAFIDDFHAEPSTTDAVGEIFLWLNPEQTQLHYEIGLDDLLALKPVEVDRTEPDDIIGIHLHKHVPDTIGPHVLNIFGWPGHEDDDLVIDYENRTMTGIWDNGDASRDPVTGELYLQNLPLTSKLLDDWIDTLNEGLLMLAVHTNESGFSTMAIHGHISPVPEPAALGILLLGLMGVTGRTFRVAAVRG